MPARDWRAPEQPIAHISDAVGYGTLANFNRQFKLLTSMTPRAYRAWISGAAPQ